MYVSPRGIKEKRFCAPFVRNFFSTILGFFSATKGFLPACIGQSPAYIGAIPRYYPGVRQVIPAYIGATSACKGRAIREAPRIYRSYPPIGPRGIRELPGYRGI